MMLERLLQLAGPETTIILCSDHGFESGAKRPRATPREPAGPAVWHRQFGILVMAGPGIKQDERIYGASLIDIAPTVLTIFDLPIGEDMDGRPLLEAFEIPPETKTIESWEKVPGESGMHSGDVQLDPDQAQELMQQFAALGYIEDPGVDKEKAAESADIEAKYNISRTYLWKSEPDLALPLLEEIARRRPWEDRFLSHLALCYFQNGYLLQAEKVISAMSDNGVPEHALTMLLLAKIKFARGDLGGSYESLLAAEAMNPQISGVYTQIGNAFERLYQWDNAQAAYEKAIAIDEDNAFALEGLSSIYRRKKLNQETADMALRAVSLLHRLPMAHFNLGVAMARSGEPERAILAFETALRFQPKMVNAHRYLATLHRSNGSQEKAALHQEEVAKIVRSRPEVKTLKADRSDKLFDLPEIPKREERLKILLKERPDPKPDEKKSGKVFVLVSGLPRSGTSLMMQMLAAGGMKILTDEGRVADVDNPKGYYEWEPIKQIGKNPELLDEEGLEGRAIKCISMLLQKMPLKHNYKVIFMTRPIEEVVVSQNAMVNRLATKGAELDPEQLKRGLRGHRNEILHWLKSMPNMEFVEIDYPKLVKDPESETKRVADFLGPDFLPHSDKMTAVIDPLLYRRKKNEQ